MTVHTLQFLMNFSIWRSSKFDEIDDEIIRACVFNTKDLGYLIAATILTSVVIANFVTLTTVIGKCMRWCIIYKGVSTPHMHVSDFLANDLSYVISKLSLVAINVAKETLRLNWHSIAWVGKL